MASSYLPPPNSLSPWQISPYTPLQIILLVVYPLLLILTLIMTGLRLWSRRIQGAKLRMNDWLAFVACFFNLGFFVVHILQLLLGTGRSAHQMQNPGVQVPLSIKTHVPANLLWALINTTVKLSMAHLYLTLFSPSHIPSSTSAMKTLKLKAQHILRSPLRLALALFTTVALGNLAFAFVVGGFGCGDKTPAVQSTLRKCLMVMGSINLVLDLVVIILPMPLISRLKLRPGKKWALIGVFALGFIITGISALRVVAFSDTLKLMGSGRLDWNHFRLGLYNYAETSLSVANACAPVVFPALVRLRGWFRCAGGTDGTREKEVGDGGGDATGGSRKGVRGNIGAWLDKVGGWVKDMGTAQSKTAVERQGSEDTKIGDEESQLSGKQGLGIKDPAGKITVVSEWVVQHSTAR